MKFYESSAIIEASPDEVWDVLTDADGLAAWDSGIERVEGHIALGQKIKLYSEVSPGRAFPLRVTELSRPERMVWSVCSRACAPTRSTRMGRAPGSRCGKSSPDRSWG